MGSPFAGGAWRRARQLPAWPVTRGAVGWSDSRLPVHWLSICWTTRAVADVISAGSVSRFAVTKVS